MNITKEKLSEVLSQVFDEGLCGYKDLKEYYISNIIESLEDNIPPFATVARNPLPSIDRNGRSGNWIVNNPPIQSIYHTTRREFGVNESEMVNTDPLAGESYVPIEIPPIQVGDSINLNYTLSYN